MAFRPLAVIALFLVAWSLAVGAIDAAPGGADAIVISHDLRSIDGPDWSPMVSDLYGDFHVAEVALWLAQQLSLNSGPARYFAMEDVYDAVDPGENRSVEDTLELDYRLRAIVRPTARDSSELKLELWLEDVLTDQKVADRTYESYLQQSDLGSALLEVVRSLLEDMGSPIRDHAVLVDDFVGRPFRYHLQVAASRTSRTLGRRYGRQIEPQLLEEAETHLRKATRLRGVTDDSTGRAASLPEFVETLALHFRYLNLTQGLDKRFERDARKLGELDDELDRVFPQLRIWRVKALLFAGEGDVKYLTGITNLAPELAEGYFADGLLVKSSDLERAQESFRAAVARNPAHLKAHAYLAGVTSETEPSKARKEFERLFEKRDYPFGRYKQAVMQFGTGRSVKALGTIRDHLLDSKEFYAVDGYVLEALIEIRRENWDEAEIAFVSSLPPTFDPVKQEYLAALTSLRQKDELAASKLASIDERLESLDVPEDHARLAYAARGILAAHSGRKAEAWRLADAIQSFTPSPLLPDDPRLTIAAARIYQLTGKTATAHATALTVPFKNAGS